MTKTIDVSSIKFREDLYPRINTSPETVQKYAEDLSVLPPIDVNQHRELIDGWHRWTAHRKVGQKKIIVNVVKTKSDEHLLELAIIANAKHGLQMSLADKKKWARFIYRGTSVRYRKEKKKYLEKILSVGGRTIRCWLARTDKDAKAERNKKIIELWETGDWTQEAIAEEVGVGQMTVSRVLFKTAELPKRLDDDDDDDDDEDADELPDDTDVDEDADDTDADDTDADFTNFKVPLYNVWKFKEKTSGSEHPGNSDVMIVDRLLYLYTKPNDIVVDPFAGGGSTIDICKKRQRRYYVSDRKPIVERESEISKLDVTSKVLPGPTKWGDVKLVYLDPPYWKQMQGKYSKDPNDLANMTLEKFHDTLERVVNRYAKKLKPGAVIALLMQPTQWKAPKRQFTDHVAEMLRRIKIPVDIRISCPYESQQCTPQMVIWAKEKRKLLVLSRELIVWKV